MRALLNAAFAPSAVAAPVHDALVFHRALDGYGPTPLHALPAVAAQLGLGDVLVKDESSRLGLPAFKILGASWAVERALRERPDVETLVAASAGNHGRAVAHAAARRGLKARIFLPARSVAARREAIASEGAQVVVVDGTYEDAVAEAQRDGAQPGSIEIADVGAAGPAEWVIDGYATLFTELAEQAASAAAGPGAAGPVCDADTAGRGSIDMLLVPVGVGSLAAAAARFGAAAGVPVVGVEPETAACLTASLAAGEPTVVETPGTSMAGLDCAEVSEAAWPSLHAGILGTVTVSDDEVHAAMRDLAAAGLTIGDSGAAPLAALRALRREPSELRDALALGPQSRVALIATEGPTDPEAYERITSSRSTNSPS